MRRTLLPLIIILNFCATDALSQNIIENTCDSTILTRKEYERCKSDTAWKHDIIPKVNYIVSLKTELLPKYRIARNDFNLPKPLQESLKQFKKTYDTVLNKKLLTYEADMDENQQYVRPKAYISSLLSLQLLKIYPDIYAVLLNDVHLALRPKTTQEELKAYKSQVDNIIKSIPSDLYKQLVEISNSIDAGMSTLSKGEVIRLFRGSIDDDYRSQCNVVNFLLWTN